MFINILSILIFFLFFLFTKNYQKEFFTTVDKKNKGMKYLYPGCLYILTLLRKIQQKEEKIKLEEALYFCKKAAICVVIFVLFQGFSAAAHWKDEKKLTTIQDNCIKRPEYGEGVREIPLFVHMKKEKEEFEKQIVLEVEERQYTNEQWEQELEKAKVYIDKTILKENSSLDFITTSLEFIEGIPNTPITIDWDLGFTNLIERDGSIHNQYLVYDELLTIEAIISYEDKQAFYPITLKVKPKQWKTEDLLTKELEEALEEAKIATATESHLVLPDKIGKNEIIFQEETKGNSGLLALISIFLCVGMWKGMDEDIQKKQKEKEREMILDYPEIINKVTLLLGAGMTMKNVWGKVVKEYKQKNQKRYVYEEMLLTWHELKNGVIESIAYENFGNRVKLLPYLKFSSLLVQNGKKGTERLLELLERESMEALKERKELTKQLGEEASTKLLLPMLIMLILVLAIIMIPAFTTFIG